MENFLKIDTTIIIQFKRYDNDKGYFRIKEFKASENNPKKSIQIAKEYLKKDFIEQTQILLVTKNIDDKFCVLNKKEFTKTK